MISCKYPYIVMALDIGGTKIAGALLYYNQENVEPCIAFKDKVAAQAKEGADVFLDNICGFAKRLKAIAETDARFNYVPLVAVGMGSAGRINRKTGDVDGSTDNFPGFQGTKLTQAVGFATGLPAYALNDVQAHTLGEARWGAGKDVDNFVMLAVGTGIGGTAVLDKKLMMGTHGYAGELGHVQVAIGHDVPCPCGKVGHLEGVASGTGIENSYLRKTGKKLNGAEISKLANEGDKDALYAIELAGRCLGSTLAVYMSVFDPELIVLSGSVVKSGNAWKRALMQGYQDEAMSGIEDNLQLEFAKLGDEAALFGAAEYAIDSLEQSEIRNAVALQSQTSEVLN